MKPKRDHTKYRLDVLRKAVERWELMGLTGWELDCEVFALLADYYHDEPSLYAYFRDLGNAAYQAVAVREVGRWQLRNDIDCLVRRAEERRRVAARKAEIEARFRAAGLSIGVAGGRVKVTGKRHRLTPDLAREAQEYRSLVSAQAGPSRSDHT